MPKRFPRPTKASLRRGILVIHLWLGIVIGLYFAVVGATGSVLVFRVEIDGMQRPETVQVAPPAPGARLLPLSAVVADLHAAFPQAKPNDFSTIMMPHRPGGAYSVFFTENRKAQTLTIDPYDGRVLRRLSTEGKFMTWVRDLHVNLLQKATGEIANGYASLFAALLLLSGLWLWWPATVRLVRNALTIKRGVSFKRILHDLHNTVGFYILLILFIVTLTGTALVFNKLVQARVFAWAGTPVRPRMDRITPGPGAQRLSIDDLSAAAQSAVPDGELNFITIPTKRRQPFYAMFHTTYNGFAPYAYVYLDPYTGKTLRIERDDAASAGQIIMRQVSVLHFGEWGGIPSKILYCLIGLAPLFLFVTGVWMYLRKRIAKAVIARRHRVRGGPGTTDPIAAAIPVVPSEA